MWFKLSVQWSVVYAKLTFFIAMLSVIMLNAVMASVVILSAFIVNVVRLSVLAPFI